MANEIERKFLVKGSDWRASGTGASSRQGYLSLHEERVVRVRIMGEKGFLTVKGKAKGLVRPEYEYEIPLEDAEEMLERLCERPLIEKRRYRLEHEGVEWEVDEFEGENEGLVLAEVELEDERQEIPLPAWAGREVTGDPKYYNVNLVRHPYRGWR